MKNSYKKLMGEAEDFFRLALKEYQRGKKEMANGRNGETEKEQNERKK